MGILKGIRVRNMESKKGNMIPNQFIISTPEGEIFQSYNSIIAIKQGSGITLDEHYWDYSATTGRYRNIFLGESKKETEKKIKLGVYKLEDLNDDR